MGLKREKGWKITTIQVTIKHRPEYAARYLAADLRNAVDPRSADDIKAVRIKRIATPKGV